MSQREGRSSRGQCCYIKVHRCRVQIDFTKNTKTEKTALENETDINRLKIV